MSATTSRLPLSAKSFYTWHTRVQNRNAQKKKGLSPKTNRQIWPRPGKKSSFWEMENQMVITFAIDLESPRDQQEPFAPRPNEMR